MIANKNRKTCLLQTAPKIIFGLRGLYFCVVLDFVNTVTFKSFRTFSWTPPPSVFRSWLGINSSPQRYGRLPRLQVVILQPQSDGKRNQFTHLNWSAAPHETRPKFWIETTAFLKSNTALLDLHYNIVKLILKCKKNPQDPFTSITDYP